tara:strand:+ start:227 stop:460 length:234 start_codon:yes stop_codon:yes gene_type:complete
MKEHFWETQIDSDIGLLDVIVTYDIIEGQSGDYDTPHIHPEVSIKEIKITQEQNIAPEVIDFLTEEIEDEIRESQPE